MLKNIINAAYGREKADIVLKNGKIIDVTGHSIIKGNVGIKDGVIIGIGDYEGLEEIDVKGAYVAPGLVDSHIHIESAMVSPGEYAKAVMPKGVTSIIADPHEIANVCGEKGLEFMFKSGEGVPLDIYYMLPSCVPATPFDHGGAVIDGDKTKELMKKYGFKGLGEMMNYPGVVNCDDDVIKKLESSKYIDGHAPMIEGMGLNAYICGGISNDHECDSKENALEKISKGMNIFIREGTGAKNLEELIGAVDPYNLRHFAFCTDDKHLSEILREGTISHCIDKAIGLGMDPIDAYTIACYNPCVFYDLHRRGAIAPGFKADIIVTRDINCTDISLVLKDGKPVAKEGKALFEAEKTDIRDVTDTVRIQNITAEDLSKEFNKNEPVIELSNSLVTNAVYCENSNGLSLCANIERYGRTGNKGLCFVKGLDIVNGAIAQTIGHDSHNISVIGSDSENMAAAVNALGKKGGIAVVQDKKVIAYMELAIGGLMSDKNAASVVKEHEEIIGAAKKISHEGSNMALMILGFISLLVIPHIKLGDKGLFDVDKFSYI